MLRETWVTVYMCVAATVSATEYMFLFLYVPTSMTTAPGLIISPLIRPVTPRVSVILKVHNKVIASMREVPHNSHHFKRHPKIMEW